MNSVDQVYFYLSDRGSAAQYKPPTWPQMEDETFTQNTYMALVNRIDDLSKGLNHCVTIILRQNGFEFKKKKTT